MPKTIVPKQVDNAWPAASAMPLGDHLEELRRRVILGLLGILPIFIGSLAFGRVALEVLIEPLREVLRRAQQPSALLATGPFETFSTYMHLSVIATVLLGSPWLLYQLWRFVAPGLYTGERRFVRILVPLSAVLTVVSGLFLYYVILPVVLAFFVGFGAQLGFGGPAQVPLAEGVSLPVLPMLAGDPPAPTAGQAWINTELMQLRVAVAPAGSAVGVADGHTGDASGDGVGDGGAAAAGPVVVVGAELVAGSGITQQYRVSEYVKTVLNLALAFGVGFQTPVVVVLLGWSGLVTRVAMRRYWRIAAAVATVAGAVLTPADPLSMILLAVPLYVLYELGLVLLLIFPAGSTGARTHGADQPGNDPDQAGGGDGR